MVSLRLFQNKRYFNNRMLFCINSGRSGSEYLSKLLCTAKGVNSFHEPEPNMSGKYLRMINEFQYPETFKKRRYKCKGIKKILKRMSSNEIYCETNHMFIKTFFDVILEDFKNVEVIILRRELSLVLKSGMATKTVWAKYYEILKAGKNEFDILLNVSKEDLLKVADEKIVDIIIKNREGALIIKPGFDGEYGVPVLSNEEVIKESTEPVKKSQTGLKDYF